MSSGSEPPARTARGWREWESPREMVGLIHLVKRYGLGSSDIEILDRGFHKANLCAVLWNQERRNEDHEHRRWQCVAEQHGY